MFRRISLIGAVPLLVIALAGCSSSPVTLVEVDPKDQVPTMSAEPSPSPSETSSPTASPTPTEVDESSQRVTCDGKDATIVSSKNVVQGTPGDDVIVVRGLGEIVVEAGAGNDAICVFTGTAEVPISVTVFGGEGNDRFYGSDGVDSFFSGPGNNEANTYGGNDVLVGGSGKDILRAGDGDDYIRAGDGSDVVYAGAGTDVIAGEAGEDTLYGQEGSDVFYLDKADNNQNDATAEDSVKPNMTLAQYEAQRVQAFVSKATSAGLSIVQGSGPYLGLVLATKSDGVIVAAFPGTSK